MKNSFEWLRKLQFPLFAASSLAPLSLIVFAFIAPQILAVAWSYPVCCVLLAAVSLWVPDKFRMLFGFCGSGLLLGLSILLVVYSGSFFALLPVPVFVLLLFYSLRFGRYSWYEEIPRIFGWVGIGLYILAQSLMNLLELDGTGFGITAGFLIFVLLFLLSLNRTTLNGATVRHHRAANNVRQKNHGLVLSFFLLVAFVMSVPSLLQGIGKAIVWVISTLASLFREEPESGVFVPIPETRPQQIMGNGASVTGFAIFMQHIQKGLVNLLAYVGGPVLCLLLIAKLPWLIRKIAKFFAFYRLGKAGEQEDYIEQISKIPSRKSRIRKEKTARQSRTQRRNMTPSQKIRYRYQKLQSRHPNWAASSTARDNLPVDAAPLYEKIRYGAWEATDREAEQFITETKGL